MNNRTMLKAVATFLAIVAAGTGVIQGVWSYLHP